jgi:geranylgeranyl diphosphate synthase, type II
MHTINRLRDLYNNYASNHSFEQNQPAELYQPLDYILALGGKQMRPVLLLMAAELFDNKSTESALAAAYAIELFHNFSLIHDDIMDQAPIRRGMPTVHNQFGTNTAILSGDVMLVYAYHFLLETKHPQLHNIFKVFNETAIGVCEGQQMDMNFEKVQSVDLEEYIRMIELKTSVLLHGAMKIGAILANASDEEANYIAEFGRSMGIAFQLQDDYLDSFGEEANFGKRIGGDIIQNKKTYLFLKALELATITDKTELLNYYALSDNIDENDKIENVKLIFLRSGAVESIQKEMQKYQEKALDALEKINTTSVIKTDLSDFLNQMMKREQ